MNGIGYSLAVLLSFLAAAVCCPLDVSVAAPGLSFTPLPIKDAASGSNGLVLAIVADSNDPQLVRFDDSDESWIPVRVRKTLPIEGLAVSCLVPSRRGGVYSIWERIGRNYAFAVFYHDADRTELIASLSTEGEYSARRTAEQVVEDGFGSLWLVGETPFVYRVMLTSREVRETALDPDYFGTARFTDRLLTPSVPQISPLAIASDHLGQVWFYNPRDIGWGSKLKGLLVFDGEAFKHTPTVRGISRFWPTAQITNLVPKDNRTMYAVVRGTGVFEINIKDFSARAVAEPEPRAFASAWKIFPGREAMWVVSLWGGKLLSDGWSRVGNVPTVNRVWRCQGGACTTALSIGSRPDQPLTLLETPSGTWIGTAFAGAWFLPAGGNPVHYDWRRCNPLVGVDWIFALEGRRTLLLGRNRGALLSRGERSFCALDSERPKPEFQVLDVYERRLHLSADRTIWFLAQGDEGLLLKRWDGKQLSEYALPYDRGISGDYLLRSDALGQLWLIGRYNQTVAVLNTGGDGWRKYLNFRQALESEIKGSDQPFQLEQSLVENPYSDDNNVFRPVTAADGRYAYFDRNYRLHYFDGHSWRDWQRTRPLPNAKPYELILILPADTKSVMLGKLKTSECLELDSRGAWRAAVCPDVPVAPQKTSTPTPEQFCDGRARDLGVFDDLGRWWVNSDSGLLVAVGELCSRIFPVDLATPFIDGRQIEQVGRDARGNDFFVTRGPESQNEYLVALNGSSLPKLSLKLLSDAPEATMLVMQPRGHGPFKFRFRLDEFPWSAWSANSEHSLAWIPPGKHRIEAEVLDAALRAPERTALLEFEIQASAAETHARLLKVLKQGSESERNQVLDVIRRFPEIKPELLAAREKAADAGERWWLDLALQELGVGR